MTKRFWRVFTAVLAVCCSGVTANAGIIYNANNEFKAYELDPTHYEATFGNFRAGTGTGLGNFTQFATGNKTEDLFGAGLQGWNITNLYSVPFVVVNPSVNPVDPANSIESIAPSEIVMHGVDSLNAVLRFTATYAGNYTIQGNWQSLDSGTTRNLVLKNFATLFSSTDDNSNFNLATTLLVGDTIDFVVNKFDGLGYDSTGLFAQIELVAVPEPTTMTLLALGGIGLVGLARRKRKTNVVA